MLTTVAGLLLVGAAAGIINSLNEVNNAIKLSISDSGCHYSDYTIADDRHLIARETDLIIRSNKITVGNRKK